MCCFAIQLSDHVMLVRYDEIKQHILRTGIVADGVQSMYFVGHMWTSCSYDMLSYVCIFVCDQVMWLPVCVLVSFQHLPSLHLMLLKVVWWISPSTAEERVFTIVACWIALLKLSRVKGSPRYGRDLYRTTLVLVLVWLSSLLWSNNWRLCTCAQWSSLPVACSPDINQRDSPFICAGCIWGAKQFVVIFADRVNFTFELPFHSMSPNCTNWYKCHVRYVIASIIQRDSVESHAYTCASLADAASCYTCAQGIVVNNTDEGIQLAIL